jgi:tyrosine-protein kinase Etk/Wzc
MNDVNGGGLRAKQPLSPGQQLDDEISLREVWNLLRRNALTIITATVLSVAAAATYSFTAIPVWESLTSIRIDEEQTNLPVLDILQSVSGGSQVETEMEVLRSRVLAEQVVDSLQLQVSVSEPKGVARVEILAGVTVDRTASEALLVLTREDRGFVVVDEETGETLGTVSTRESLTLPGIRFALTRGTDQFDEIRLEVVSFRRAVEAAQAAMTVSRPNREAGIVTLQYQSADTSLVHEVPNRLAESFIRRRQRILKTEATSTVDFLDEQIDTLQTQLTLAEEALVTFREGARVVSPDAEADAQVTQLVALQAQRNVLESERSALQGLVDDILGEAAGGRLDGESPWVRLMSFPPIFANQAASQLLNNLNLVENERNQLARQFTDEHPDMQILAGRLSDIERQLEGIVRTYLQGLTSQVTSYDETLVKFGDELGAVPAVQLQLARLERQQVLVSELFSLLQTRRQEARIAQAVEDPSIRIVDLAILPAEPVKPRKLLNIALGLTLGLMLGVGLAFVREYMDETVHTREDLVEITGVPVMGTIPRIRAEAYANGKGGGEKAHLSERLVAGHDPRGAISEAYRSLRTNVTFASASETPRTLVFTSPVPGDGKTTSAANFAITLAQLGRKALLIDADLRRGVLHTVFGTARENGLSDLLVGNVSPSDAIRSVDLGESGTIDFVPTGTLPPNPAELLGSEQMRRFLHEVRDKYDTVILDSAPLTVVTDAAVLGTKADGVLLVARASSTPKGGIRYATEQLRNVRAPILGMILNDVDYRREGRYATEYYGRYGYVYGNYESTKD